MLEVGKVQKDSDKRPLVMCRVSAAHGPTAQIDAGSRRRVLVSGNSRARLGFSRQQSSFKVTQSAVSGRNGTEAPNGVLGAQETASIA